jgi:Glycosyl hydrolase family 57
MATEQLRQDSRLRHSGQAQVSKYDSARIRIAFAFVHHANQYLITEGYDNRHGLRAAVGSIESKSGFAWILELHRRYKIPANLHLSGTLLESIAWHQPDFLSQVRELFAAGLIGLVGSCYAQNIMRFFSYEHNLKQLNEELLLYKIHLGLDPDLVKVFWPPERVWDTARMAPVLKDPRLLNHGYEYVLVDDRLLLPGSGPGSPRKLYDRTPRRDAELYQACTVQDGHGLIALPIASHLRLNIPPGSDRQFSELVDHCRWLTTVNVDGSYSALIAVYADDMEKAAGLGPWNKDGPEQFERVLRSLSETPYIQPLRICDWAAVGRPAGPRPIEVGTFVELANHFAAGEGYEKWFFDPQWDRYREYFLWAERRVERFSLSGADPSLIDLAEKHLIASSWESAWHTPPEGPFGNPDYYGQPSPWIQALGSHCRHAAVIGEAAHWASHHDEQAHAKLYDIDADGEDELVLKNDKLFAVISPRWGGRLVALFNLEGPPGKMVIGNPSDDWNWMQELNRFMEVPPNHPGALTDVGFEHDTFTARVYCADGATVDVELENIEAQSAGRGLTKRIRLSHRESRLEVCYAVPESIEAISVDFAFSPDYLNLLRYGRALLTPFEERGSRGWSANSVAVWVREEGGSSFTWSRPFPEDAGHKASLRLSTCKSEFTISIGVSRI